MILKLIKINQLLCTIEFKSKANSLMAQV